MQRWGNCREQHQQLMPLLPCTMQVTTPVQRNASVANHGRLCAALCTSPCRVCASMRSPVVISCTDNRSKFRCQVLAAVQCAERHILMSSKISFSNAQCGRCPALPQPQLRILCVGSLVNRKTPTACGFMSHKKRKKSSMASR